MKTLTCSPESCLSAPALPTVLNVTDLSPHARAYWLSLARKLAGQVNVIDPYRSPLRTLRASYPGQTVYRASTGGKWGKSSQIVKL